MSRVALVAGCTGINGSNLVNHLLNSNKDWTQVIALSRAPCEREPWWGHPKLKHISVDLMDKTLVRQKFEAEPAIGRVTHAFFMAYAHSNDDDELTRVNGRLFENFLEALDSIAEHSLQRVCLVTGTKYYGVQYGPYKTPARENDPRLDKNVFYYVQEDCLARLQQGKHWTWTVIRPQDVIGFSWKSGMNQGVTIAVYAVLCKALGLPFIYPGTRASYSKLYDSSSVRAVVRMLEWSSLTPGAANEAFNCVNGDVYRMEQLWPTIGRYFGLEALPPPETGRFRLQEQLGDMREAWRQIVAKFGLAESRLEELVTWDFTDFMCAREYDCVTDMSKARDTGFLEYFTTDLDYLHFFDRLKSLRIIPDFGQSAASASVLREQLPMHQLRQPVDQKWTAAAAPEPLQSSMGADEKAVKLPLAGESVAAVQEHRLKQERQLEKRELKESNIEGFLKSDQTASIVRANLSLPVSP